LLFGPTLENAINRRLAQLKLGGCFFFAATEALLIDCLFKLFCLPSPPANARQFFGEAKTAIGAFKTANLKMQKSPFAPYVMVADTAFFVLFDVTGEGLAMGTDTDFQGQAAKQVQNITRFVLLDGISGHFKMYQVQQNRKGVAGDLMNHDMDAIFDRSSRIFGSFDKGW